MSEIIPQPTLGAILKYSNHPSISAIEKFNRTRHQFFFSVVEKEDIITELQELNPKKATQETEIPVKLLKDIKTFLWDMSKCSLMMQLNHLNFHHL